MSTSPERRSRFALRWGLIALGAQAFIVARLLRTFLGEWTAFVREADGRVLANRLSQLKPVAFKWPALATYAYLLGALLVVCVLFLFALGLRQAWRGPEDPPAA